MGGDADVGDGGGEATPPRPKWEGSDRDLGVTREMHAKMKDPFLSEAMRRGVYKIRVEEDMSQLVPDAEDNADAEQDDGGAAGNEEKKEDGDGMTPLVRDMIDMLIKVVDIVWGSKAGDAKKMLESIIKKAPEKDAQPTTSEEDIENESKKLQQIAQVIECNPLSNVRLNVEQANNLRAIMAYTLKRMSALQEVVSKQAKKDTLWSTMLDNKEKQLLFIMKREDMQNRLYKLKIGDLEGQLEDLGVVHDRGTGGEAGSWARDTALASFQREQKELMNELNGGKMKEGGSNVEKALVLQKIENAKLKYQVEMLQKKVREMKSGNFEGGEFDDVIGDAGAGGPAMDRIAKAVRKTQRELRRYCSLMRVKLKDIKMLAIQHRKEATHELRKSQVKIETMLCTLQVNRDRALSDISSDGDDGDPDRAAPPDAAMELIRTDNALRPLLKLVNIKPRVRPSDGVPYSEKGMMRVSRCQQQDLGEALAVLRAKVREAFLDNADEGAMNTWSLKGVDSLRDPGWDVAEIKAMVMGCLPEPKVRQQVERAFDMFEYSAIHPGANPRLLTRPTPLSEGDNIDRINNGRQEEHLAARANILRGGDGTSKSGSRRRRRRGDGDGSSPPSPESNTNRSASPFDTLELVDSPVNRRRRRRRRPRRRGHNDSDGSSSSGSYSDSSSSSSIERIEMGVQTDTPPGSPRLRPVDVSQNPFPNQIPSIFMKNGQLQVGVNGAQGHALTMGARTGLSAVAAVQETLKRFGAAGGGENAVGAADAHAGGVMGGDGTSDVASGATTPDGVGVSAQQMPDGVHMMLPGGQVVSMEGVAVLVPEGVALSVPTRAIGGGGGGDAGAHSNHAAAIDSIEDHSASGEGSPTGADAARAGRGRLTLQNSRGGGLASHGRIDSSVASATPDGGESQLLDAPAGLVPQHGKPGSMIHGLGVRSTSEVIATPGSDGGDDEFTRTVSEAGTTIGTGGRSTSMVMTTPGSQPASPAAAATARNGSAAAAWPPNTDCPVCGRRPFRKDPHHPAYEPTRARVLWNKIGCVGTHPVFTAEFTKIMDDIRQEETAKWGALRQALFKESGGDVAKFNKMLAKINPRLTKRQIFAQRVEQKWNRKRAEVERDAVARYLATVKTDESTPYRYTESKPESDNTPPSTASGNHLKRRQTTARVAMPNSAHAPTNATRREATPGMHHTQSRKGSQKKPPVIDMDLLGRDKVAELQGTIREALNHVVASKRAEAEEPAERGRAGSVYPPTGPDAGGGGDGFGVTGQRANDAQIEPPHRKDSHSALLEQDAQRLLRRRVSSMVDVAAPSRGNSAHAHARARSDSQRSDGVSPFVGSPLTGHGRRGRLSHMGPRVDVALGSTGPGQLTPRHGQTTPRHAGGDSPPDRPDSGKRLSALDVDPFHTDALQAAAAAYGTSTSVDARSRGAGGEKAGDDTPRQVVHRVSVPLAALQQAGQSGGILKKRAASNYAARSHAAEMDALREKMTAEAKRKVDDSVSQERAKALREMAAYKKDVDKAWRAAEHELKKEADARHAKELQAREQEMQRVEEAREAAEVLSLRQKEELLHEQQRVQQLMAELERARREADDERRRAEVAAAAAAQLAADSEPAPLPPSLTAGALPDPTPPSSPPRVRSDDDMSAADTPQEAGLAAPAEPQTPTHTGPTELETQLTEEKEGLERELVDAQQAVEDAQQELDTVRDSNVQLGVRVDELEEELQRVRGGAQAEMDATRAALRIAREELAALKASAASASASPRRAGESRIQWAALSPRAASTPPCESGLPVISGSASALGAAQGSVSSDITASLDNAAQVHTTAVTPVLDSIGGLDPIKFRAAVTSIESPLDSVLPPMANKPAGRAGIESTVSMLGFSARVKNAARGQRAGVAPAESEPRTQNDGMARMRSVKKLLSVSKKVSGGLGRLGSRPLGPGVGGPGGPGVRTDPLAGRARGPKPIVPPDLPMGISGGQLSPSSVKRRADGAPPPHENTPDSGSGAKAKAKRPPPIDGLGESVLGPMTGNERLRALQQRIAVQAKVRMGMHGAPAGAAAGARAKRKLDVRIDVSSLSPVHSPMTRRLQPLREGVGSDGEGSPHQTEFTGGPPPAVGRGRVGMHGLAQAVSPFAAKLSQMALQASPTSARVTSSSVESPVRRQQKSKSPLMMISQINSGSL